MGIDNATRSLDFGHELVVDLFAGGGGASTGLGRAYREPDIAVNHNPVAIAVHRANHPHTKHLTCDVFEIDPRMATQGRPVGVLWASPDCRHHSKAKGGKPRNKKIRGLAWVVIKWASACKPRVIHLENVEEFADWGTLRRDGTPDPAHKGKTFRRWIRELEKLGYVVEHRELIAADFGAPTIRKRLYVIARCDGRPILWPAFTHSRFGAHGLPKWRAAAECIEFDRPACSIFADPAEAKAFAIANGLAKTPQRPLKPNTMRRVAKGLWRHVLSNANPFIVPLRGTSPAHTSTHGVDQPISTVTGSGTHHGLAMPVMVAAAHGEGKPGGVQRWGYGSTDIDNPLPTVTGSGGHAVAAAHLVKFRFDSDGADLNAPLPTVTAGGAMHRPAGAAHALGVAACHLTHLTHHGERSGHDPTEPFRTVTGAHRGEQAIVAAHLEQANGGFYDGDGRSAADPLSTICASGSNQRLVSAYFVKYYGEGGQHAACNEPMHTLPTKDRMGVVQVVQLPIEWLAVEHRKRAKACADLMHQYLPEHFPTPADFIMVGNLVLVDVTLRMLIPRELARGQGFGEDYIIDRGLFVDEASGDLVWRPITKTDQVKLIGNSVCPGVAEALARANTTDLNKLYQRIAA